MLMKKNNQIKQIIFKLTMVDFKKVKAPNNTITRNPALLASKADNIYEAVAVIG